MSFSSITCLREKDGERMQETDLTKALRKSFAMKSKVSENDSNYDSKKKKLTTRTEIMQKGMGRRKRKTR